MILTENMMATFNLAYIDTLYDKYTGGQCFYGRSPDNDAGQCDLSGEGLPSGTKFKANIALNWRRPFSGGDLYSRLDHVYSSSANASSSLDPQFDMPASNVTNLRFGWRNESLDFAVWGKNITDEVIINRWHRRIFTPWLMSEWARQRGLIKPLHCRSARWE
mgnify:CR=1 FL=1